MNLKKKKIKLNLRKNFKERSIELKRFIREDQARLRKNKLIKKENFLRKLDWIKKLRASEKEKK